MDNGYKKYYSAVIAFNDNKSSLVAGSDTLEKCMADAFKSGTYYLSLYDTVEISAIYTGCTNCNGQGKTLKRSVKWIKCPECKGKGLNVKIMDKIPLLKSNNVTISNN